MIIIDTGPQHYNNTVVSMVKVDVILHFVPKVNFPNLGRVPRLQLFPSCRHVFKTYLLLKLKKFKILFFVYFKSFVKKGKGNYLLVSFEKESEKELRG